MCLQLQASKAALCAIVLLLAVLLALSGVMLGSTVLAGQSLWGHRAPADVGPCQPCDVRGVSRAGRALALPALERSAPNSSHLLQDLTHQGETPC